MKSLPAILLLGAAAAAAPVRVPLVFEENLGQSGRGVDYVARAAGYTVALSRGAASLLVGSRQLEISIAGACHAGAVGIDALPGVSNYIQGADPSRWIQGARQYGRVRYSSIKPGVDMVYYGNERQLEYDLVVGPGTDPSNLEVVVAGADRLSIDKDGDLLIAIGDRVMRQHRPVVYQQTTSGRKTIAASYRLSGNSRVQFNIANYDHSLPLVIDPILDYFAAFGGSGTDRPQAIGMDPSGAMYIIGVTNSPNFPTPSGTTSSAIRGRFDLFVMKLDPTGRTIIYTTFLGGAGTETAGGIAVDARGQAYITGVTDSSDFPTTSGAFQRTYGGQSDAFVARLNFRGGVTYSSYIGGSGAESSSYIAVPDGGGNATMAGATTSANFPVKDALQARSAGAADVFVARINGSGSELIFSTYLGGSGADQANAIVIDAGGAAYVTGSTTSANFPTVSPAQASAGGDRDVFVTKISPQGSSLVYSTFFGGSAADDGNGIALTPAGHAYIVGTTASRNFPTTPGAFLTQFSGDNTDAFVFRLDSAGKTVASSYFGGPGFDNGNTITVLDDGRVYFGLYSNSDNYGPANVGKVRAAGIAYSILQLIAADLRNAVEHLQAQENLDPPLNVIRHAASRGFRIASVSECTAPPPLVVFPGQSGTDICVGASGPVQLGNFEPDLFTSAQLNNSAPISDPISSATGEFYTLETDLRLGGLFPLDFHRYYSSMLSEAGISTALGNNWMHVYDVTLTLSGDNATVRMLGGRRIKFRRSGSTWSMSETQKTPYQFVTAGSEFKMADTAARTIYTFNATGALTRVEDRNGNAHTLMQTAAGPTEIADGLGRKLSLTYTAGKLTRVQDQSGRAVTFAYIGDNLASVKDVAGQVTTYEYLSGGPRPGLLVSKTLPSGAKPFTQTYDAEGRVNRQVDALGAPTAIAYAPGATTITNPDGTVFKHGNTLTAASLNAYTDAAGKSAAITYDSANRQTSVTDRNGDKTSITYHEPSGAVASQTDSLGKATTFTHTAQQQGPFTFYNLTRIAYPDVGATALEYDASGNITKLTIADGRSTRYTYNSRGQYLTVTGPGNGVRTVTYNADGMQATARGSSGQVTTFAYDDLKRLTKVTSPDQSTRELRYNERDSLVSIKDPLGRATTFSYDIDGRLAAITDPAGNSTRYTLDAAGRIVARTNRNGKTTRFDYDQNGKLTKVTGPDGDGFTYAFDAVGRLTGVNDAVGSVSTLTYDAEGIPTAFADGAGNTWTFQSDKLGRVTSTTRPTGATDNFVHAAGGLIDSYTNALSETIRYSYNSAGVLSKITAPGEIEGAYESSADTLKRSVTDPNGSTWRFEYDDAGNKTKRVDPLGNAIGYTYDSRGRLIKVSYPGSTVDITYDAKGNMLKKTYSDGAEFAFAYDENDRITTANGLSLKYDAAGFIADSNGLAITRDGANRLTSIAYAPDKVIRYTYNSRGLLAKVEDWVGGATEFTYNAGAQLTGMSRPNGVTSTYSWNADGAVTNITDGSLASIAITRDALGRITATDRSTLPAPAAANKVAEYSYDAASQLSSGQHDTLGRLLADGRRTFTWDVASRLAAWTNAETGASYQYDSQGLMLSRQAGDKSQRYVWSYVTPIPSLAIAREADGDKTYYVYSPAGSLLYSINAADGARRFYHFEEAGNTTFLTDDSGAVTDTYAISPYGEVVTRVGTTDNPFTYQGLYGVRQEGDGLFYMRARFYDSTTARFISRDPIFNGSISSMNPYHYASGNPVMRRDPLGKEDCGWFDLICHGRNAGRALFGSEEETNPPQNEPVPEQQVHRELTAIAQSAGPFEYVDTVAVTSTSSYSPPPPPPTPAKFQRIGDRVFAGTTYIATADEFRRLPISQIIALGGGNLTTAQIVALGGGNIVANGGGNIVALGGGNIVALGGGNIVALGGGNIIANGGGNIVALGGGNLATTSASSFASQFGQSATVANILPASAISITAANPATLVGLNGSNLVGLGGSLFNANTTSMLFSQGNISSVINGNTSAFAGESFRNSANLLNAGGSGFRP